MSPKPAVKLTVLSVPFLCAGCESLYRRPPGCFTVQNCVIFSHMLSFQQIYTPIITTRPAAAAPFHQVKNDTSLTGFMKRARWGSMKLVRNKAL